MSRVLSGPLVLLVAFVVFMLITPYHRRQPDIMIKPIIITHDESQILVEQNYERGIYMVVKVDSQSMPGYIVLESSLIMALDDQYHSMTRYCIARLEEGIKPGDEVEVWEVKIGNNPPCHLAKKLRDGSGQPKDSASADAR